MPTFLVSVTFFVVSATCAGAGPLAGERHIPRAARRIITEANAEWLRAMKSQNAAAIADPYADEGVFVTAMGEASSRALRVDPMLALREE